MSSSPAAHPAISRAPAKGKTKSKAPLYATLVAAVVAAALVAWLTVRSINNRPPRLNESTEQIARFVSSATFNAMPFDRQRQYYKVLDDRDKELDKAFTEKRISEPQYRAALDAAWLGKHLNRVEKYFALQPGAPRAEYVDELVTKKLVKTAKKAGQKNDDIDADESTAEARVASWPYAPRDQWKQFHDAYRKQKKIREASGRPVTAPAKKKPK